MQNMSRKITRAAAAISLSRQEKLWLGNLDAKRDWGHACEYVRGMWLMMQQDEPDDYVLAAGETTKVRTFVDWLSMMSTSRWDVDDVSEKDYDAATGRCVVEVDPRYFWPTGVELLIGDPTKAQQKFGWSRETSVRELTREMVREDLIVVQDAPIAKHG